MLPNHGSPSCKENTMTRITRRFLWTAAIVLCLASVGVYVWAQSSSGEPVTSGSKVDSSTNTQPMIHYINQNNVYLSLSMFLCLVGAVASGAAYIADIRSRMKVLEAHKDDKGIHVASDYIESKYVTNTVCEQVHVTRNAEINKLTEQLHKNTEIIAGLSAKIEVMLKNKE